MIYQFSKSCIGFRHVRDKKPCQDFSASYHDSARSIVTCCDGHGGAQYVRSEVGSRIASDAVMEVFRHIDHSFLAKYDSAPLAEQIKLLVLCEYNKLIERELAQRPIRKHEYVGLSVEQTDTLRFNPAKAYGTTLSGAMFYQNRFFVISIGDTETLGVQKGELIKIFDNANDPVGNVTYSMCQEDAFQHLRVAIIEAKNLDGVILCSDGLSGPYQTYGNLMDNFLRPTIRRLIQTQSTIDIEQVVDEIALRRGNGDDVSLSFLLRKETRARHYR